MPRVKKEKVMPNPAEIAFAVAAVEKAVAEPEVVIEKPVVAPVVHRQPCGLDDAPVGSKIVVIRDPEKRPVLNTPSGPLPLANGDVAYQLPEGAKIRKRGVSLYVAEQLNPTVHKPDLVTATAREAIAQFLVHFHDQRA